MRAQLPDFPWDALAALGATARTHPDGIIDLSQGTPIDPTPEFIQRAFRDASNSPSYPVTAGTPELRTAIKLWAIERLGASGDFDVLPLIGSKELVAWLPSLLESQKVLIPEISYPTYHVGALIAQAQSVPVGIDATHWPSADLAWMNSPSNPTGRVHSIDEIKACINSPFPPITSQRINVSNAIPITIGTNTADILSTSFCTGALLLCAS